MATLAALGHGMPTERFILLTTLNAATQRVPAREVLREASFTARVGDRIDEAALRTFLVRMGFSQAPTVTEPGDFAVRGGIIDIYPPGETGPVRLDLFGDVLDGARRFDPATQRTTEKLTLVELAPVSRGDPRRGRDHPVPPELPDRVRRAALGRPALRGGQRRAQAPGHRALAAVLPRPARNPVRLPARAPAFFLDDQATPARLSRWEGIADQYETRARGDEREEPARHASTSPARRGCSTSTTPPGRGHGGPPGDRARRRCRSATGPGVIDAGGRIGRNFAPERQQEKINLFSALADHVRAKREQGPVVVASYSEGARERLKGLLADEGLTATAEIADFRDVPEASAKRRRLPRGLAAGAWLRRPGAGMLTVISEQDVLGDRLIRAPKKRRKAENFLTEASALSAGDLVVHVDHGVGRYNGLETITAAGAPHECLALEYAGGDRLFLPVENIELLTKYGHEEGLLDKLGGGAWQAKKARLKERIREIADKLIRLAAERALRKAPVLEAAAPRLGGVLRPLPLPGDRRPAQRHRRRDRRHRRRPADGPADLRRRRLRQDRGGDARGLRRRDGRRCRSR